MGGNATLATTDDRVHCVRLQSVDDASSTARGTAAGLSSEGISRRTEVGLRDGLRNEFQNMKSMHCHPKLRGNKSLNDQVERLRVLDSVKI